MKRIIVYLFLTLLWAVCLFARNVNIVMNDGSVIKGGLLGKTADDIFIETTNGQSVTVHIADIKSAFDQDTGESLDLTEANADQASGSTNTVTSTVTNTVTNTVNPEPQLVVIPGTYVYYYDYGGYDCFYYGGYWWRPWQGYWYRSYIYSGGWVTVNITYVPYYVYHLPVNWRTSIVYGPRVGWASVRVHWSEWQRTGYWANRGWRGNAYIKQGNYGNKAVPANRGGGGTVQRKREPN